MESFGWRVLGGLGAEFGGGSLLDDPLKFRNPKPPPATTFLPRVRRGCVSFERRVQSLGLQIGVCVCVCVEWKQTGLPVRHRCCAVGCSFLFVWGGF